jgi:hypothetical protein
LDKTAESYKADLEDEVLRWRGFAKALRGADRTAFEELMDACRSFASAGNNASQTIIFEPMVMSMLLFQQAQLMKLEKRLYALSQRTI